MTEREKPEPTSSNSPKGDGHSHARLILECIVLILTLAAGAVRLTELYYEHRLTEMSDVTQSDDRLPACSLTARMKPWQHNQNRALDMAVWRCRA